MWITTICIFIGLDCRVAQCLGFICTLQKPKILLKWASFKSAFITQVHTGSLTSTSGISHSSPHAPACDFFLSELGMGGVYSSAQLSSFPIPGYNRAIMQPTASELLSLSPCRLLTRQLTMTWNGRHTAELFCPACGIQVTATDRENAGL